MIDRARLLGHRQITDAYLLALAVAHDGRLVTFDTVTAVAAVHARESGHLPVI